MLGYYDYTVWLTYMSLILGGMGILISQSGTGHPFIGMFFLMLCGLCDAFDGKVARTKMNRTRSECNFGIQIDSLTDLVSFGVLPISIGNAMIRVLPTASELRRPRAHNMLLSPFITVFYGIMVMYLLAAMIRLAYFNVEEEERQCAEGGSRKYYKGLPVTSVSLIFPILLSLQYFLPWDITSLYFVTMMFVAMAFLMPIPIKKPGTRGILIMVAIGAADFVVLAAFYFHLI